MNYILIISKLMLVASLSFSHIIQAAVWTAGHGDLGIGYEDGELEPHWHLGEDNEVVTLDGAAAPLGADGEEFEADEIIPETNLLQTIGGTDYYVFPQNETPEVPFIGFGTEELEEDDWTGDIVLTLTGTTGPGNFFLFGQDTFGATSTLMASGSGGSISLAPHIHTHHIWAFSQAGNYTLTFQVDGIHSSEGAKTTVGTTFGFTVVPEPSTAGLLLGVAVLALTVVRRR